MIYDKKAENKKALEIKLWSKNTINANFLLLYLVLIISRKSLQYQLFTKYFLKLQLVKGCPLEKAWNKVPYTLKALNK